MILDALLRFSNAQTIAVAAGTVPSTDEVDFGLGTAANPAIPSPANGGGARDMGVGDSPALKFVVQMVTAAVGGTLQVVIQGAPDNGTGVPGAYTSWWASPVYTAAVMTQGARLLDMDMPRPPAGVAVPRFVRLAYIIGGTMTGGSVSAYLVLDRDDQMYNATNNAILGGYPPGLNVAN
jgi:hypothetical protein